MRVTFLAALAAVFAAQSANAFTWDLWTADCATPATKTPYGGCATSTHPGALSQSSLCADWGSSYETKYFTGADCTGDVVVSMTNATSTTGKCTGTDDMAITCTRNYGKEASPAAAIVLGIISGLVVFGELGWFIYFKINAARNPERNPFDE